MCGSLVAGTSPSCPGVIGDPLDTQDMGALGSARNHQRLSSLNERRGAITRLIRATV